MLNMHTHTHTLISFLSTLNIFYRDIPSPYNRLATDR